MTKKSNIYFNYFVVLVCPLVLFSCSTAHFADNASRRYYSKHTPTTEKAKTACFIYKTAFPTDKEMPDHPTKSTTTKKQLLPLLFYFNWYFRSTSDLNTFIPVNNLITSINKNAKDKGLQQKLNGEKIELTINSIPHQLNTIDKGFIILFLSVESFYIENDTSKLDISYRILNGDNEVKKGNIVIEPDDKKVSLGYFESERRLFNDGFTHYDENIAKIGKEIVERLYEIL